jgi:WD40 repeat protein
MSDKEKAVGDARTPAYELFKTLDGHAAGVSSVEFSPNGKYIASSCNYVQYYKNF